MAQNNKCEYDNDGVRITAPGKFEGEPLFAPDFWNLGLEGCADEDTGSVYVFRFTAENFDPAGQDHLCLKWAAELKAWLGTKRTLRMRENDQGFVHCF